MEGTVKFFDNAKGWGYVRSLDGKEYFVHYSNIQMKGHKTLDTDDHVWFEISEPDEKGRIQAFNVWPLLTKKMIEKSLKEEGMYIKNVTKATDENKYLVVDANNVIQTSEQGISFLELANFAGFYTDNLSA